MPKNAISGWYNRDMFSFIRKCPTVFKTGYTTLHSHQQSVSDPISQPFHIILHSLMVLYQYFIEFYIFISLMANDAEHLFMCVSAIYRYLVKCSFISFVHFLIGLFILLLFSFEKSLYILDISPLSDICPVNIFS